MSEFYEFESEKELLYEFLYGRKAFTGKEYKNENDFPIGKRIYTLCIKKTNTGTKFAITYSMTYRDKSCQPNGEYILIRGNSFRDIDDFKAFGPEILGDDSPGLPSSFIWKEVNREI